MGLIEYIVIVVVVFVVGTGGYFLVTSFSGPRKIEEIDKMIKQGQFQGAIDELVKLLDNDDRNMRARMLLARTYGKMGNWGAAVLEYRQCLKIGRYTPEASEVKVRSGLAKALLESKQYNEAKNEFLILTSLEPRNSEHFFELGQLFFRSGVYAKAVPVLQKAANINEKHADCLNLLGQAHFHLAAYQDARAALLKAVQVRDDLNLAHYFLGLTLRYLQDNDWALKEFEKAERDQSLKVKSLLGKGMVLIDMESYPKAVTELDRGIKYAPPGSEAEVQMRYLMALAAEKSRDMHTAIQAWEKVESISPGYRDVRNKLKQYAEFRMDDSIKDFMIASNTQFEGICRQILQNMNLQIVTINLEGDSQLRAVVSEEDSGKRQMRKMSILVDILRDNMTPVSENQVREFHEVMKHQNLPRGIIMTTGEIMPQAAGYASTRPIDLFDTSKLVEYVRAAMA